MKRLHQTAVVVLGATLFGFSTCGSAAWSLGNVVITEYSDATHPVDPTYPCAGEAVPAGSTTKVYRCKVTVTNCNASTDGVSKLPEKQAILRVTVPSTGTSGIVNTAILFTGGAGTGLLGDVTSPDSNNVQQRYALDAINKLVSDGFRTVEVAWQSGNWAKGSNAGPALNACRPASVIDFVRAHFGIDTGTSQIPGTQALHAMGNSAGASQIAYSLSHYGLADKLTSTILGGGPPYARIDLGCFYATATSLAYSATNTGVIDSFFGTTACQLNDSTPNNSTVDYQPIYEAASVISAGHIYSYPTTKVHFIFGTADITNSEEQGMLYTQRLLDEKTKYVAVEHILDMEHELPKSQAGMEAVYQALRSYKK